MQELNDLLLGKKWHWQNFKVSSNGIFNGRIIIGDNEEVVSIKGEVQKSNISNQTIERIKQNPLNLYIKVIEIKVIKA